MSKKVKMLFVVSGLLLLALSKKGLIFTMSMVDLYGEKTNTCVVEEIDFLNEIYYTLHEDLL